MLSPFPIAHFSGVAEVPLDAGDIRLYPMPWQMREYRFNAKSVTDVEPAPFPVIGNRDYFPGGAPGGDTGIRSAVGLRVVPYDPTLYGVRSKPITDIAPNTTMPDVVVDASKVPGGAAGEDTSARSAVGLRTVSYDPAAYGYRPKPTIEISPSAFP